MTSTTTRYFHQDHLGSATRVTDATGALVEQAEYIPFGEMRPGSSSPPFASNYKYTDQEMDVGTGLYNYDARMYDPIIGRFISPDPIVPDPANSQALNRYSYVLNNPLRYVDPSGNYYSPKAYGYSVLKMAVDYAILGPYNSYVAATIRNDAVNQAWSFAQSHGFNDLVDNPANAYLHFIWSTMLTDKFGPTISKWITDILHEGFGDKSSMDYFNNSVGRQLSQIFLNMTPTQRHSVADYLDLLAKDPNAPQISGKTANEIKNSGAIFSSKVQATFTLMNAYSMDIDEAYSIMNNLPNINNPGFPVNK